MISAVRIIKNMMLNGNQNPHNSYSIRSVKSTISVLFCLI